MKHVNLYLNPVSDSLFKKYSSEIKVNIPNFEKIQLTRIDMVVRHEGVPYPDAVPTFPVSDDAEPHGLRKPDEIRFRFRIEKVPAVRTARDFYLEFRRSLYIREYLSVSCKCRE